MTYTFLQRRELALGKESLTAEALALLKDSHLNYLQMRTLRLAMEKGLSVIGAKKIAKPEIDVRMMEEYCQLALEQKPFVIPRRKRHHRYVFLALLVGIALFLWIATRETPSPLTLRLVQEQIRLPVGMRFEPERYVRRQDLPQGAVLLLPDAFTAAVPEMRLAVYEVRRGQQSVKQILKILIVDETKPELELSSFDTQCLSDEVIDWRSFIVKAYDAVDGDLRGFVSIEVINEEAVLYQVQDRAGNRAEATLKIQPAACDEEKEKSSLVEAMPIKTTSTTARAEESIHEESGYEESSYEESISVFDSEVEVAHSFSDPSFKRRRKSKSSADKFCSFNKSGRF